MTKKILIVESDAAVSRALRAGLERAGFEVEETTDGKGTPELIRRERPELVVLAVELTAGQNGYIICGKLKKDDELKATPVVIIGSSDGFAQHRKLKTRADDYLAKPVDAAELVERVGLLIGLPPPPADTSQEGLSLSDLVDERNNTSEFNAEEIAVEQTVEGLDPELDMLDAAFEDVSTEPRRQAPPPAEPELSIEANGDEAPLHPAEDAGFSQLATTESTDSEDESEKTQVGISLPPMPAGGASFRPSEGSDGRELRTKISQLQGALDDANDRVGEREARIRELELELDAKSAEVDAARSTGGGRDKEVFSLRDAATKKDKEILRLKSELHEKEKELVELQESNNGLEQKSSELGAEVARKEAASKSVSSRIDALTTDKKKLEAQVASLKEESRGASSHLNELQSDLDQALERLRASDAEVSELRSARADLEQQSQSLREDLDRSQQELGEKTRSLSEQTDALRQRVAELEDTLAKQEERAGKLSDRTRADETRREKARQALALALEMLEERTGDDANDEGAVA